MYMVIMASPPEREEDRQLTRCGLSRAGGQTPSGQAHGKDLSASYNGCCSAQAGCAVILHRPAGPELSADSAQWHRVTQRKAGAMVVWICAAGYPKGTAISRHFIAIWVQVSPMWRKTSGQYEAAGGGIARPATAYASAPGQARPQTSPPWPAMAAGPALRRAQPGPCKSATTPSFAGLRRFRREGRHYAPSGL